MRVIIGLFSVLWLILSVGAARRGSDEPSPRVNATDELWAFFKDHPRD